MRVLFDDRTASNTTGIGRYTRTLTRILSGKVGDHDVRALSDLTPRFAPQSALEAALSLPSVLERDRTQLFHTGFFSLPPLLPCPAVITIHDAIPVTHPELTNQSFADLFARCAGAAAQQAIRVVCPTAHAAAEVAGALGLDPERLCVIPEAPAGCFRPAPRDQVAAVLAGYGITRPYTLTVGSLEDRKDPETVLQALALAPADLTAVFVGPHAGFPLEARARALGVWERVRSLGHVPDAELACLYTGALALVHASLAEGFGLPVVEAFACETPVLAARASALPEVVGEAGLLFEPQQPEQLAELLRELEGDPQRSADLRQRGAARLATSYSLEAVRDALRGLYDALTPTTPTTQDKDQNQ